MSRLSALSPEFASLLEMACSDAATFQDLVKLESMASDQHALEILIDFFQLDGGLHQLAHQHSATEKCFAMLGFDGTSHEQSAEPQSEGNCPPPPSFSSFYHATVGYLSQEVPFSLMIGAAITGLLMLVAWLVPVDQSTSTAKKLPSIPSVAPAPMTSDAGMKIVGEITGMIDCQWADQQTATIIHANVPLGRKYALKSGLLEITYHGGARVVLRGPAAYQVESHAGGFLSGGRLLARIDKKPKKLDSTAVISDHSHSAPLFTVKTPTAIVTDLGTEFGVDVARDGQCEVHVIQGNVRAERAGQKETENSSIVLSANQAARFSPKQKDYQVISISKERFQGMHTDVTRRSKLQWPILDKTLVVWVSPAKPDQRNAQVFSLINGAEYDGIALGSIKPRKWMSLSPGISRTEQDQSAYADETAKPGEMVQIAITYTWEATTIYRNGRKYAEYAPSQRAAFAKFSYLMIGRGPLEFHPLSGEIEEARLYDVALSPESIAALRPNIPSQIAPIGCWTFEDGTLRDSAGHFPVGEWVGTPHINQGKLILDNENFVLIPAVVPLNDPFDCINGAFDHDIAPWSGQIIKNGTPVADPRLVSYETQDICPGSKGVLKVQILKDPRYRYLTYDSGALCKLTHSVAPGTVVRVSFFAKSIQGATWLKVSRMWGGSSSRPVEIGPTWKHYDVDVAIYRSTGDFLFNLVSKPENNGGVSVADGTFLLGQVRVTDRSHTMQSTSRKSSLDHISSRPGD